MSHVYTPSPCPWARRGVLCTAEPGACGPLGVCSVCWCWRGGLCRGWLLCACGASVCAQCRFTCKCCSAWRACRRARAGLAGGLWPGSVWLCVLVVAGRAVLRPGGLSGSGVGESSHGLLRILRCFRGKVNLIMNHTYALIWPLTNASTS